MLFLQCFRGAAQAHKSQLSSRYRNSRAAEAALKPRSYAVQQNRHAPENDDVSDLTYSKWNDNVNVCTYTEENYDKHLGPMDLKNVSVSRSFLEQEDEPECGQNLEAGPDFCDKGPEAMSEVTRREMSRYFRARTRRAQRQVGMGHLQGTFGHKPIQTTLTGVLRGKPILLLKGRQETWYLVINLFQIPMGWKIPIGLSGLSYARDRYSSISDTKLTHSYDSQEGDKCIESAAEVECLSTIGVCKCARGYLVFGLVQAADDPYFDDVRIETLVRGAEWKFVSERARKLGRASSRGPEAPIMIYNDPAQCTYRTRLSLTGIATPVDKRAPAPFAPLFQHRVGSLPTLRLPFCATNMMVDNTGHRCRYET
ncbi:predicted protein [Postia placenta Mad-698-R]|nr:predicted protein [Postia placenta Mad-698-R]